MKLAELFDCPSLKAANEIMAAEDFAIGISDQLPDFNPRWAKVVGTADGRDVWGSRCFGDEIDVFAFRTENKCDAFIALSNTDIKGAQPLMRVWCAPAERGKGLTAALLGFVTKKLKNKLLVAKKEPLTKDGKDWLIKLIKNPRGFIFTTVDGKQVNPVDVEQHWNSAKTSSSTEYEFFIENHRTHSLWGDNYPLVEASQHLGDPNLD